MKKFLSLLNKNSKTVIGILSGTSVDGVDVALLNIRGNAAQTVIKVVDFKTYPVAAELKKFILRCSSEVTGNTADVCKLNFMIGHLFADSILKIIKRNNLITRDIDLIGSHGQTIFHFPFNRKLFSLNSKSTLQAGELSVIANRTGITTVGDFRTADMAVNGQGAPLVPYLDYILFSDKNKSRVLINIGGISNITFLNKSCERKDVKAFDSGPGNMMIDYIAKKYFNKKYDRNGIIGSKGNTDENLFDAIQKSDKYFKMKPPKSTGREYYSERFTEGILKKFKKVKPEDLINTFTRYTAYTIHHNIKKYNADEIIISGGGANNKLLMKFIREYFSKSEVSIMNDNGINNENKEAVLFAVLANEILCGNKANMKSVTGSDRDVFLGKICIA